VVLFRSVWVDMLCVCLVCGKSNVIGPCVVIMWGVVGGGLMLCEGVVHCVSRLSSYLWLQ